MDEVCGEEARRSSIFVDVPLGRSVEEYELKEAFRNDDFPNKMYLAVGSYRDDQGRPWVLPVVRKAEQMIQEDAALDKEYLPALGLTSFTSGATQLVLGKDSKAITEDRVIAVQALGGTGALRISFEFLAKVLDRTTIYVSEPTWDNHKLIPIYAGGYGTRVYRYWSKEKQGLDLEGMLQDLRDAPHKSVILLHAAAHNPTGTDPDAAAWVKIADVIEEKCHFPVFDLAYQGFATGDLDKDAWAVRYFVEERNLEAICCVTFSKNMGLYNERVGVTIIVTKTSDVLTNITSQLTLMIRANYSNPVSHGARIASLILNNPDLTLEWNYEIKIMTGRIEIMRKALRGRMEALGTPWNWDNVTNQTGMFYFSGLSETQVKYLLKEYHIYILKCGRINISGLTLANIDYYANAMDYVIRNIE